MNILKATAENFGSYKSIEFNPSQGLTLISGPTGSGKSALCDLIPWVLFGVTAKNGAADEVKSWNAEGPTWGEVCLSLPNGHIVTISRTRGPNDLVMNFEIRGSDLRDTQRLIDQALGMTAEIYLSGAYFHEFCTSATFFSTTAKARREITEQIVDLTLHTTLTEKSTAMLKTSKASLNVLDLKIRDTVGELGYSEKTLVNENKRLEGWESQHEFRLAVLRERTNTFEDDKMQGVKDLEDKVLDYENKREMDISALRMAEKAAQAGVCLECGQPITDFHKHDASNKIEALENKLNPFLSMLEKNKNATNTYAKQLISLEVEINPHSAAVLQLESDIVRLKALSKKLAAERAKVVVDINDYEVLKDTVALFRSISVQNTILSLETTTNDLIAEHFDGEIRVSLTMSGDDKLEVLLTKDGNECAYTQLSKGQRQILKLSFGIAVMQAVSNQHAIDFNQLFFDESLDGLDESLKLRAISLFEKLSADKSVFIVEHSNAVKAMVNNRIEVTLVDGNSQIEQA